MMCPCGFTSCKKKKKCIYCIRETTYRKCENTSMRESLSPSSGRSTVPIYSTSFRTLTLEPRTQVHLVLFLHLLSLVLIMLFLTVQDALAESANLQSPAGRFLQLDLATNPQGKICPLSLEGCLDSPWNWIPRGKIVFWGRFYSCTLS